MNDSKIKVSIIVPTYNHEDFITEAINSILMQKVEFYYEIIIADDCSKDSTLLIAEKFYKDNPDKIKILKSHENLGVTKNYQRAFYASKGEYIAVLEGDDYWISPVKLQRQVTFLEEHHECSFCFNRIVIKNESTNRLSFEQTQKNLSPYQLLSTEDLIHNNFIGNFSACIYRKSIINKIDKSLFELNVYDWMFNIVYSLYGVIGYIPEIMTVYRYHSKSAWSSLSSYQKGKELLEDIDKYNKFLKMQFNEDFQIYKNRIINTLSEIRKDKKPKFFIKLLNLFIPPIVYIIAQYLTRIYSSISK